MVVAVALLAIAFFSGRELRPSTAQDGGLPHATMSSSAYVAAGTCQALDESSHELDGRSGVSRGDRVGSASAALISYSMSQIPARLEDLLATPHAIVVRPQSGSADDWAVCGEIGGFVDDDGLVVGLRPARGDGLAGIAILWDDGDAIEVELYLAADVIPRPSPAVGA